MSGIDEQRLGLTPLSFNSEKARIEYEKWLFGYLECVECGHRIYQDVPWNMRNHRALADKSIDEIKDMARERYKRIYGIVNGITDLRHKDDICGGKVIYEDI